MKRRHGGELIDTLLDQVEWEVLPAEKHDPESDMPYTTHKGVLDFCGLKWRCYVLSTGERVFDADDVERFLLSASE